MNEFGLRGRLGSSDKHLRGALKPLNRLQEALRAGHHGAGAHIVLWLVACIVPTSREVARRHADSVVAALEKEPQLFDLLQQLIAVRNDVFHEREGEDLPPFARQPDLLNESFMRAWSAIVAGSRAMASSSMDDESPPIPSSSIVKKDVET